MFTGAYRLVDVLLPGAWAYVDQTALIALTGAIATLLPPLGALFGSAVVAENLLEL